MIEIRSFYRNLFKNIIKFGGDKMEAYYEYQVRREDGSMTNINPFILKDKVVSIYEVCCGLKFLESFYLGNWFTECLYGFLKLNKKAVVNTVCNYDSYKENVETPNEAENTENAFKYMQKYGKTPEYTKEELEVFQKVTDNMYFDKPIIKRYNRAVIACPERKQYFVFKEFLKEDDESIEPLALLTRSSNKSQGSGDFDVDYVNNAEVREFKGSLNFDKNIICSWKNLEIEYLTEIPLGYEDITEKIKLISLW